MARAKAEGNGELRAAIQQLIQAQATLTALQAKLIDDRAEMERRWEEVQRRNDERFARIEAILLEHSRILRALPDAVRDKIGFKAPPERPS